MQETKNDKDRSPLNQWVVLNQLLFFYKCAGAALACVCVLLVILALVLTNRKPIVALTSGDDYLLLPGEAKALEINAANVERFVESYIKESRKWSVLDPEVITKSISPLVTDGFAQKALIDLKERKQKQFVGKAVSQDISSVHVSVTKDATTAEFDVILRVDGLPLIVPTQVSLELVRGPVTPFNRLGLYVNGETLHEGK